MANLVVEVNLDRVSVQIDNNDWIPINDPQQGQEWKPNDKGMVCVVDIPRTKQNLTEYNVQRWILIKDVDVTVWQRQKFVIYAPGDMHRYELYFVPFTKPQYTNVDLTYFQWPGVSLQIRILNDDGSSYNMAPPKPNQSTEITFYQEHLTGIFRLIK